MSDPASEVERIMRERALALAREQKRVDERPARGEALVVKIGRARYAVPLTGISSLVVLDAITPLPGAPKFVAGLSQVKGHVLTIVDLGVLLGEAPGKCSAAMLVQPKTEAFGLGIGNYETVVALPANGLAPPPPSVPEAAFRYVEGVLTASGLGLLRLDAIIGDLLRDESGDGDRQP